MRFKKGKDGFYCRYVKRVLDVLCALLAMIAFCWLYAIIAVLVWVKLGSPVIFRQPRPGKDEKTFLMYKFRSMTNAKDKNGELLPDDVRLTKFGKMLRATSLDELPEAWNILKGDMSIIGPRPLLIKYLPYYTENERHRHDVRPGLSGWAQVNGRNKLNWDERLGLDVYYTKNLSFPMDLKIVALTVNNFLRHKDVESDGTYSLRNLNDERQTIHGDI